MGRRRGGPPGPGRGAAARPLVAAWERYRAAWWALPDDVRRAAEGAFFAKHPKCPMADLQPCPLARRAVAAMGGAAPRVGMAAEVHDHG